MAPALCRLSRTDFAERDTGCLLGADRTCFSNPAPRGKHLSYGETTKTVDRAVSHQ
jgi:hypothetical protein